MTILSNNLTQLMIVQPTHHHNHDLRLISQIVETIEIFVVFIVLNNYVIDNITMTIFFQFS